MIIPISGPHGSGKTTLMQKLAEASNQIIIYPEDRLNLPKIEDNYYERTKSKLLRYHFEELDQKRDYQPDKILLVSRCPYDSIAYSAAYQKLGWISSGQLENIMSIVDLIFTKLPENIIIINPSLEILQKQLENRWKNGGKKFKEDDFEYLAAVRQEFELLGKDNRNFLYLTDEPLEEKIEKAKKWLKKCKSIQ